ncbi:hypothetical protein [Gryllotalpicola koreensis]|uniref:Uncharacterized protein n=1 Tax=Gryllotalpicola koreensis TaxID=993086 RepID=A0ABP8A4W4_9MICO
MPSSAPVLTRGQLATVIVAVLAVVGVIIAALAVVPPAARAANPDLPVRAYLQAIEKGEIGTAMKIGGIEPAAGDKLLTDAAYGQASDRITAFTVLDASVRDRTGTVRTRITQGDRSYVAAFDVARASTNPFDPWRLAKQQLPEITLKLEAPLDLAVRIGGVDFTASRGALTQRVFPGSYETSPRTTGQVDVGYATAKATFEATRTDPVTVPIGLADSGKSTADRQVQTWLANCAASSELHPANCPFEAVPEASVIYSDGRWTIDTQPVFDVGEWSDRLGGWPVTTSAPGYVTFTARARQGGLVGTATTGSNPFGVAGMILPDSSGGLRFVPSANYSSPSTAGSLT